MAEKKKENKGALLGCLVPVIVIYLIVKLFIWFFDSETILTKSGAISNCRENETYILGHYAPDDLEMWDNNPSNDPSWNEPSVDLVVDEVNKVGKGILEVRMSTKVYDDNWEVSCTYKRDFLEYKFKGENIEIVE